MKTRVQKSRRSLWSVQPKLVQNIVSELKTGLRLIYGEQLTGLYLFGSYARGDADPESDIDVLVVLRDFERYPQEVGRTSQLVADLSLKLGATISPVFMREREWLHGDTPFLANVRDEAIPCVK